MAHVNFEKVSDGVVLPFRRLFGQVKFENVIAEAFGRENEFLAANQEKQRDHLLGPGQTRKIARFEETGRVQKEIVDTLRDLGRIVQLVRDQIDENLVGRGRMEVSVLRKRFEKFESVSPVKTENFKEVTKNQIQIRT